MDPTCAPISSKISVSRISLQSYSVLTSSRTTQKYFDA
jgi:hypothetical protein